jgi:hypothetical protein
MLSLAYLAYIDELIPGYPSPDATIQSDLTNALSSSAPNPIQPIAGQWSLAWGPVSYTVPGAYYQDNLMYVVKLNGATNPAQYVVAIRGTNGKALLDWFVEDLDATLTMPWPLGASTSSAIGMVSESTSIGLTILLAMQDPKLSSLLAFLTNEMQNVQSAGICFTGHSLGGALASSLALYFRDNQSSWDPASKATVTTINFAAPTAGDGNFANHFNTSFAYTTSKLPYWIPPQGLQSYADCIRNQLDIAPRAWADLSSIPSIYDLHLVVPPPGTSELVNDLIVPAFKTQNYTQVQASQQPWEWTFQDVSSVSILHRWLAEAEMQHVDAYPNLFNVPEVLKIFSASVTINAAISRGTILLARAAT